jgi:hypothetical protein
MGMDLEPVNNIEDGRYNIFSWGQLCRLCASKVILPAYNDGELISAEMCKVVAAVIEATTLDEFKALCFYTLEPTTSLKCRDTCEACFERFKSKAAWWRQCGGCYVY